MTSNEFVFWLKGYFAACAGVDLTGKDARNIEAKCNEVVDASAVPKFSTQTLQYPPGIRNCTTNYDGRAAQ